MDVLDESKTIFLARGVLNWSSIERISDRYGTINLDKECAQVRNFVGTRGRLIVKVAGVRPVVHIGDMLRGLNSSVPELGDVYELGHGELFVEEYNSSGMTVTNIGVRPEDEREFDWLDPNKLYKVHNQFVSLWFEPENA